MPLTPRQKRFVEEYLVDLDGKHAAIRAGYSRRMDCVPHKLLRNPDVARAIGDAMAARARRTGITRERVLEEYARIAFADLSRLAEWGEEGTTILDAALLDDETAAVVAMVCDAAAAAAKPATTSLRVKTFDKLKALEALARLLDPQRKADARQAPPPRPDRPH